MADIDLLREKASQFGDEWAASLTIGAGPLVAETIVGEAVGRLVGRVPGFKCFIHVDNHRVFPAMLRAGKLDLFVADITELKDANDLSVWKLKPAQFLWFCRKGHPLAKRKQVTMSEIIVYPFAMPELPVWAREWFVANLPPEVVASEAQPPIQPRVVCSHYSTLMRIISRSDALGALTDIALQREPYAMRMVALDFAGELPTSNPGIVTLKKRALPPVTKLLMDEIAEVAKGC